MERGERGFNMAQLRNKANDLVVKYNRAMQSGTAKEVAELDRTISETIAEHAALATEMCFESCKNSTDPMLKAIKTLRFDTIGVRDTQKKEDPFPVRSVVDREKQIDLDKLHTYCGEIGSDPDWIHMAMKLNMLLTAKGCKDLGIDPRTVNDSYSMSEIARKMDMGKTPTSNTQILKLLKAVVDAMLGDGHTVLNRDIAFLIDTHTKGNGKAQTVVFATHKEFRRRLAELCNRIVLSKEYYAEFKRKQEKREKAASPVTQEQVVEEQVSVESQELAVA
jgi:hypothetical protein